MSDRDYEYLDELEAEAIYILRDAVAQAKRLVLLFSIGKDSCAMLHLARKAFHPGPLPFPLLHVDTTWKFREMISFRDTYLKQMGHPLIVYTNQKAIAEGINPFDTTSQKYTWAMKTQALLEVLAERGFDAAMGGARRDEERSRAKERVFSFRDKAGVWDPKNQRPELWSVYNARVDRGENM